MASLRSFGRILAALVITAGGFFISICPVSAASAYDAALISISAPKLLSPGQSGRVVVTVTNIGKATWSKTGSNFFSLYHWDPVKKVEKPSQLATATWDSSARPLRLPVASVKPGETVDFAFSIRAPSAAGSYHGDFILCAENVAWIGNSKFSLDVIVNQVESQKLQVASQPEPSAQLSTLDSRLATSASKWSAQLISKGGIEWQVGAGEHALVEITFKNTGTETWVRDGNSYISLYATQSGKERPSPFKDASWLSSSHANGLLEAQVKPGEIGHFRLQLRGPDTPGNYQEAFTLAAEDAAWVAGSDVTFPIRVPMYDTFVATAPPTADEMDPPTTGVKPKSGSYQTALTLKSVSKVTLLGNGRQLLYFGFKNTGTAMWASHSLKMVGVKAAVVLTAKQSSVRDESWYDSVEPVRVLGTTNPGEIALLQFKLKAPAKKGTYTASFKLNADGIPVEGGDLDIPITVTADGYIEPEPTPAKTTTTPSSSLTTSPNATSYTPVDAVPLNGDLSSLPNEPLIRVGLFKTTDDKMIVRAKFQPLNVSQNGTSVCRLNTGESATIDFDRTNRVYRISGGSCTGQSSGWYAVKADDGISPMEIADFSRPVGWLPGANDNTFRGQLELRYTPSTNNVWVIDELPIEWYLKGIGETSNSSPQEYQRALLTAARTYAVYHIQHASKHADEFYIVDATLDQVYRGYGAEARDPAVVTAVDATRGQIVTYAGKLAITPYYSRSDGRTRSWTEVWGGGPYPWLVSVPVPWDIGRTLWGHGVGMSAMGALGMANDGKRYDEILKYFYTGIELRRAYK